MFPLIIDNTNVVIANPASPNGAGFAGVHPALGWLGAGAPGVTEPSKVPSSGRVAQPSAARHLHAKSGVPAPDSMVDVRNLPVVRIRTQHESIDGALVRRTA
jgi:hypothetical protein